jgi:hypothetical protein
MLTPTIPFKCGLVFPRALMNSLSFCSLNWNWRGVSLPRKIFLGSPRDLNKRQITTGAYMTKTAQITVRLTDEEFSMIKNVAAQQSMRMSDVVRKALTRKCTKASLRDLLVQLIRFAPFLIGRIGQRVSPSADRSNKMSPTDFLSQ